MLETALDAEMTEQLGYEKNDPAGRGSGNSLGRHPVEIAATRDAKSSFEPKIVRKRQRRLTGIDEIVLSLSAKGLTTGEIAAHFEDIYGASVSKDTISRIADKVIEEMTEWQNRPLDRVYPVVFIDAIHVKIRDGRSTSRSGSPSTVNATSSDCGTVTAVRAPNSGCRCSPRPRTVAWGGCVHRRLRRARGSARGHQHRVGNGDRADLRNPSDPQHI